LISGTSGDKGDWGARGDNGTVPDDQCVCISKYTLKRISNWPLYKI